MPQFVEREYGVCEDDLRKASILTTSTAWKNDEDYCADLQGLRSQETSLSLQTYDVIRYGKRLVFHGGLDTAT